MAAEDRFKHYLNEHSITTSSPGPVQTGICNPLRKNGKEPCFTIKPNDPLEIQSIITSARENRFGLVPVSSGPLHVKEGTLCRHKHARVDLSHWKEIPWINRRNRVCIVQPGVTFGELNRTLKEHGLIIPMPLAPRSSKSVLASVIDREPGTWPRVQWDLQDPVASTELVFGTGRLFRTGGAGSPGSLEKQRQSKAAQKNPLGPGQTDFQRVVMGSQGNMAIVTWISLRAELLPTLERPMIVADNTLSGIIPYVYTVQRAKLGENSFILNKTAAAMLMSQNTGRSFDRIRESIPEFVCLQNIAGFERLARERLDYQLEDIRDIAAANGLKLTEDIGEIDGAGLLQTAGSTCGPNDWRYTWKGCCLSVFFLSQLDRSESFISAVKAVTGSLGIDEERIGVYIQPILQNHACHFEFMIPFAPEDEEEVAVIKKAEAQLIEKLMEAGAFFSRPYGAAADRVLENNPGNTKLIRIAKNLFDPDNILNPGKFGL